MSEMEERVAKAIERALYESDAGQAAIASDYQEAARAAIEAMLEPTKEMVHAGCIALRPQAARDELMAASLSTWPHDFPRTKQRIRWRAMIDEALKL